MYSVVRHWNERFPPLPVLACLAGCLISFSGNAEETTAPVIRGNAEGHAGAGIAAATAGGGTQVPSVHNGARHREGATLEDRVRALTQGLDLDASQQAALRKVLINQREQILKVWNDPSPVPAAYRIGAVKAITDHTADQIRALLNDEQRKKYNPPRRPSPEGEQRPDVSAWMDAIGPRVAAPTATR